MAAYVVAHLTVHDWERYDVYGAGFFGPLEQYRGKVLMAEDDLDVVEGTPTPGRHVILEFVDRATAQAWYHSPEYQKVAQHRLAASTAHFVGIGSEFTQP
jgi:uncharacterized protein (DUF1330 family)